MSGFVRRCQHALEPQEWGDRAYRIYRRLMPFSAILMTLAIILASLPIVFLMAGRDMRNSFWRRRP